MSVILASLFALRVSFAAEPTPPIDAAESAQLAGEVKAELLHAWSGYRRYAWGHDDLDPISKKPHAVWMPPGIAHATQMGPRGCRLRTIAFPLPIPHDLPADPCVIEVSPFLAALMEAWEETSEKDIERREALRYLLYDEVRRATPLDLGLPRVSDPRLLRVTDALQADPSDTRSLEDWARLAGMSRRSFIRHFLQETGVRFANWQRRLRLLAARQLLAEGVSVTEAALSLGYRSPSAFSAMVRRELGVSPGRLGTRRER